MPTPNLPQNSATEASTDIIFNNLWGIFKDPNFFIKYNCSSLRQLKAQILDIKLPSSIAIALGNLLDIQILLKASTQAEIAASPYYDEYCKADNKEIWLFYKEQLLQKQFKLSYAQFFAPSEPEELPQITPISHYRLFRDFTNNKAYFLSPFFINHERNINFGIDTKNNEFLLQYQCPEDDANTPAERCTGHHTFSLIGPYSSSCNSMPLSSNQQSMLTDPNVLRERFPLIATDATCAYFLVSGGYSKPFIVATSLRDNSIINVYKSQYDHEQHSLVADSVVIHVKEEGDSASLIAFNPDSQRIVAFSATLEKCRYSSSQEVVLEAETIIEMGMSQEVQVQEYRIDGNIIRNAIEIDEITTIRNRPVAEIERLMKTPDWSYSTVCFLTQQDRLLDVLREDYNTCKQYGITNQTIATFLQHIVNAHQNGAAEIVINNQTYVIKNYFAYNLEAEDQEPHPEKIWAHAASIKLNSPFDDESITGYDLVLFNKATGRTFGFSTSLIPLIRDYGFFERGWYHFNITKFMNFFFTPLPQQQRNYMAPRTKEVILDEFNALVASFKEAKLDKLMQQQDEISEAATKLYNKLTDCSKKFAEGEYDEMYFKANVFLAIENAAITMKKQNLGTWDSLQPWIKQILGVLATLLVVPALIVAATSRGYVDTFFSQPKTARKQLEEFEEQAVEVMGTSISNP
jgi:hypothetical protein